MLGAVVSQSSSNWVTGQSTTWSSTTNSYIWYDGALQSSISYRPNTSQSTIYTTSFTYNGIGQLISAHISDGKPHTVTFTNDELGQVIRRDETAVSGQTGAPHEVWYRFGGRQLGYSGNNGTNDMSMAASIADRQVVAPTNPGTFRNKQMYGTSYADFAQNYDPVNSYGQGSSGGSYTVQRGETLQSIAQAIWGDASLWYKIAEVNGLSAASGLIEGQRLTLPTGVARSSNKAATFNPYDPAEAVGDLSPTTQPKPKDRKNRCGVFGQVLIAAIAIAVAVALPGGGTTLGAMLNAGIGSAVSQGVGLATGIQDKFNFKGVALSALSAGVMKGVVGGWSPFGGGAAANIANAVVRGAAGSALTQGIGVATGLQSKFDFAGVAAAGVGAGAGSFVGGRIGSSLGSFGRDLAANTAGGIANAATRSAIQGNSFGDNLIRALPDIIGQTLGSAAARGGAALARAVGESASAAPPASGTPTVGQQAEIVVTGNYDLRRLAGPPNLSMIAASGAYDGSLDGGLNLAATFANVGPLDPRRAVMSWDAVSQEIVVTAPIQVRNYVASWFRTGAGQVVTANGGVQHWGGPRSGPLATIGRIASAAGRGIVSTISGLAQSAALGWAATSNIPVVSSMARSRIASINPVDMLKSGFGHSAHIFGQAIVHDNLLPAAEAGGGALVGGGIGKLSSLLRTPVAAKGAPSIEAAYQARYAAAYEKGLARVDAQLAAGEIRAPIGQPEHLFRANRVDDFARRDLRAFAIEQGHGTDLVRINRRLYLEGTSGPYRIPDLYFPQSGTILDGTLGFKSGRTPQIMDFRAANNNAPIGIVRPENYGGFYWVGK